MPEVLVLGAGANGLATAITLLEQGRRVEIWTQDDPTATVSAVAAAIWFPFLAEPRERVLQWSSTTFAALRRLAVAEPHAGVAMTPLLIAVPESSGTPWWAPAVERWTRLCPDQVPAPLTAAIAVEVPVCDTTVHLPWLLQRISALGGVIVRRTVHALDEALAVAPTVVNCTGLGAAALCNDREVIPVRGQVVCVEAANVANALIDDLGDSPVYIVPRLHDVVLGGTAQRGDLRTDVDAQDTARILAATQLRMPSLKGATMRAVRTGLRPFRNQIRLEIERRPHGRRIVHNYGHGGSGFTLNWGCAAEVAALLAAR